MYRLWQVFLHLATEVLVCEMEGDPDSQEQEIVLNVSKKKKKNPEIVVLKNILTSA